MGAISPSTAGMVGTIVTAAVNLFQWIFPGKKKKQGTGIQNTLLSPSQGVEYINPNPTLTAMTPALIIGFIIMFIVLISRRN